jgi:crotonobetainyl-CoA:carnitine CoA-transferase CaiB-like acyl-CoA transferase
MGREELARDPRFDTNVHRTANLLVLDAQVAEWCRSLDLADLAQRLAAEDVPFTKVYSIADVQDDPHFRARGTTIEMSDPVLGSIPAPAPVPRFTGRTAPHPTVGPETGQDNAEVYGSLGVSEAELSALRQAKVI